jgi:putative ABC transport system permease protein
MLGRVIDTLRSLIARRRIEAEASEELAFHVDQETAANIARGLPASEARRVALVTLGGVTPTLEAVRQVRTVRWETLWRDVRHASRALRGTPAFTAVALVVLTLAIGVTTAVLSVVDGVVLRPLPFPEAHRLVAVNEVRLPSATVDDDWGLVAPQNFLDWHAQQRVFSGLAAIGYASISLRPEPGHEPETLTAQAVTPDFFAVLGRQPIRGRTFTSDETVDGRAAFAVISYGLWQRRFGGAPDVVGRMLPGQQRDFTILGVMPAGFSYPVDAAEPTDVWIPNVFRPEDRVRGNEFTYRLQVIGRLRDGATLESARAQMAQITSRLAAETPRWFTDRTAEVEPLQDAVSRGVRSWLLLLLAAVGAVLLIACLNVANLMLVRASARGRELDIRAALGASRWDLMRSLLLEGLLLSLTATALGVGVAWLGVSALRALLPPDVPRVAGIAIDLRVLTTMIAAAVGCAVIFSLAPMLRHARGATGSLAPQGRRTTTGPVDRRLRGALVTLEIALAGVLLVGAGLFLASFARVSRIDLGIDTQDVLTIRIRPLVAPRNWPGGPSKVIPWETAQTLHRGLLGNVLERVRGIAGVETAALVDGGLPLRGDLRTTELAIPGRVLPANEDLDFNQISADYFRVLRVPLLRGRTFDAADRETSEAVAIINDAAAKHYFPGEDPVGRTIEFLGRRRIVGVVGNIRHDGPEAAWRRQGFIPLAQSRAVGSTLVLRLSRPPSDMLPAVKAAIWSEFPGVALPDVQTLSAYLDTLIARRRFLMLLLGLFGASGLVIAGVGVYGTLAYIVSLRTQEIGIRMALGARPGAMLWSVLAVAGSYVGWGLALGLTAAWALASVVTSFLFDVQARDPWIYAGVAATLAGAAAVAAVLPARRASRVDPVVALRAE